MQVIYGGDQMCYWREGIGPWTVVGGAFMVLFWGAVIGFAVWGITRLTRRPGNHNGALAIARERFARGEISKEEFDRIKKDLT
jgi:putative membrane protein